MERVFLPKPLPGAAPSRPAAPTAAATHRLLRCRRPAPQPEHTRGADGLRDPGALPPATAGDPEVPDEEMEESKKRIFPGDPDPEQKPGEPPELPSTEPEPGAPGVDPEKKPGSDIPNIPD